MPVRTWCCVASQVRRRGKAMGVAGSVGEPRRLVSTRCWRRVKGDRDAGTTSGLAGRSRRGAASCRGKAWRRGGRRSGPLTRQWESILSGGDRRSPRSNGATPPVVPALVVPTAEPCLAARAGGRGLAPGVRSGHGAGPLRGGDGPADGAEQFVPCAVGRRFASTSAKATPGFRKRSASATRASRRASRHRGAGSGGAPCPWRRGPPWRTGRDGGS